MSVSHWYKYHRTGLCPHQTTFPPKYSTISYKMFVTFHMHQKVYIISHPTDGFLNVTGSVFLIK